MRKKMKIRLQKILAEAGLFSRRKAEEAIALGRVAVNGTVVTEMGTKADPRTETVTCDGKPVHLQQKVYLLMNKPAGVICTTEDDRTRTTVVDLVKHIDERIFPVGRLDFNTTGILLLTNDGDFAQKMMHPSSGIVKTYQARVRGIPTERTVEKMLNGISVEGVKYRFHSVRVEKSTDKNATLSIGLKEGKNLHIRILCQALGHPVSRLMRTGYGPLKLGKLKQPGDYRHLSPKEVKTLLHASSQTAGVKTAAYGGTGHTQRGRRLRPPAGNGGRATKQATPNGRRIRP